jgi:beta-glucosidase-like glycosyl hydrolase
LGGLTPYKVRVGVNAGIDMFMEPFSARQFQGLLLDEINAGRVRQERIDDAVRRILTAKFRLAFSSSRSPRWTIWTRSAAPSTARRAGGCGEVAGAVEEQWQRAAVEKPVVERPLTSSIVIRTK